jgi:CyaY protein
MTPAEFTELYEDTLMAMEEAMDEVDGDIDYETVNGILTITFENGSKIIITPQSATSQLWVAAKSGGFHFEYKDDAWYRTTDNEALNEVMTELFASQAGLEFSF